MNMNRWLFVMIALMSVCLLAFAFVNDNAQPVNNPSGSTFHVRLTGANDFTFYGMEAGGSTIVENQIKRNQPLAEILRSYNAPEKFVRQLSLIHKDIFDVRKIIPGRKFTIVKTSEENSEARAFIYELDPTRYVVLKFTDTISVEVCHREIVTVEKELTGTIHSSLSETIQELHISPELTNKVVDIFAWDIDFQRLFPGDRFKLIYYEQQVDGKAIGIEKISAANFEHNGESHYAYAFDQGEGVDYFDENGNSLRKSLLKYPIEFTRISSRYSLNRFHPIQKRYKAHLGTDFAAPTGTPIRSVGDGVILEAKYSTYNGNYVKIKHSASITTQYLHMSKIAGGIVPGAKVKQGQWIGNVGSTGLATGPHLCFRFWKNGVQVDAMKIQPPPANPIRPEYLAKYDSEKEMLAQRLANVQFESDLLARANTQ